MKRKIAVVLACIMVGGCWFFSGDVLIAQESGNGIEKNEELLEIDAGNDSGTERGEVSGEGMVSGEETVSGVSNNDETAEIVFLQIPKNMKATIDPWERNGKGQIYSEQYIIKNAGEKPGELLLTGFLSVLDDNIIVRTDAEGMHGNEEKSICMEVVYGEGDRVVLTGEGAEYMTVLEPEEELALSFTGEVNEDAAAAWKDGDFAVRMEYTWKYIADADSDSVSSGDNVP